MNDNSVQESSEKAQDSSEGMVLDGESWKNRNSTTYKSVLDVYGVPELFSTEKTNLYMELEKEKSLQQEQLTDYIFSAKRETDVEEQQLVNQIFAREIEFSENKSYSSAKSGSLVYSVIVEALIVLVFIVVLVGFNSYRRKRRTAYAAETDVED